MRPQRDASHVIRRLGITVIMRTHAADVGAAVTFVFAHSLLSTPYKILFILCSQSPRPAGHTWRLICFFHVIFKTENDKMKMINDVQHPLRDVQLS